MNVCSPQSEDSLDSNLIATYVSRAEQLTRDWIASIEPGETPPILYALAAVLGAAATLAADVHRLYSSAAPLANAEYLDL